MRAAVAALLSLLSFHVLAADPAGSVTALRPAPGRTATGLAYDGKRIWVADQTLDQLIAIAPADGQILARLKSPGYRPAGLAWDGEQLWCVDTAAARIYRLRTTDGLTTREIPSPVAVPRALAFDGLALWVSDDASRTLHRVDPEDGTTLAEVGFPDQSVDGLAYDGRYLWVADRLADKLYALWPEDGQVIASLPSPGPHPTGLAFDGQQLLVADYQTDAVASVAVAADAPITDQPRRARVEFINQVRNFGPDRAPLVDLYLAVPGDRPSQRLHGAPEFVPAPKEFLTDAWGQRVAHFQFSDLAGGQTAEVRMRVELTASDVHQTIYPHRVGDLWKIPRAVRKRYLGDGSKYQINAPVIRRAVAEAVGKEQNPYWIARKIYRHIHAKMHYEMVGGWDVAPKVLARGSGSCSEYSFVFIAMCRAAGLPARYVGALVVRKDDASYDDVFHRWVEIYLPPYGWVPVDPSRGDKKSEAARADSFGHLYHDFLITTEGGGGSEFLRWNYNVDVRHTCQGRCRVEVESIGEWEPVAEAPTARQRPASPPPAEVFTPDRGAKGCGDP